ncbi:suppressor of fused domain protein [Bradyrhizobium tropiciagri]|uniref:suppressor of fused domain protein n=1 Tax=Bradyrhizobium tropiciagri TaxID=312253 RepID=UPI000A6F962E|nr:suppressor of fused domain protein [Bradyrhizobium tropiciagri]
MDLEEVWRLREEAIYPTLFGPVGRGIFPLTQELFSKRFGERDVDPRWLFLGVFEFPPTPERSSWLYVTSGYSNSWNEEPAAYDPTGEPGFGVEFTFAVSEQGDWAVETLQSMLAFDLLLGAGRFRNRQPFSLHDRIPLGGPLNGQADCEVRNLIVVEPEHVPHEFSLPSGRVLFVGFTGVSDAELTFAKMNGSEPLISRLRAAGHHPTTNPHRRSLI